MADSSSDRAGVVREGSPWYRFVKWLVRNTFWRLAGGVETRGEENIPTTGPTLIAPIHISHLDPPLIGSFIPRHICFMAKKELFKPPIMDRLLLSLGAFPVERDAGDTKAVRTALDILNQGRALLIFPEGTRGDGRHLGEIQAGISLLARRTGAIIVPIGISGTEKIFPRGSKRFRRHRVTLVYGRPFSYQECGDDRERFVQVLRERLLETTSDAGLELLPSPPKTTSLD
ncbi:MAG: 1-acyl-sn-glycerol-3-phosphate acyltransferase [Fimbriimonadaceae bacterium]|nr:1-acyl-sn-glycerol-3-phosphate acyltransferase [Fimbriimonadaceae bacterium]